MKSLVAAVAVLATTSAFANLASLPAITGARLEVSRPHPMTPVQPTAHIAFEYSSCRQMSFRADLETSRTESTVTMVKLNVASQMDCFGPSIKRSYRVQVSSDFRNERYVILNPIATAR